MGTLTDTIKMLAAGFARQKPAPVAPEVIEKERIREEQVRAEEWCRFTLVAVMDELNAIHGLNVTRLFTKDFWYYQVKFGFAPAVKATLAIKPAPKHPLQMEVIYTLNVGSPGERRHTGNISTDDDAQKIISIFEQGIKVCGPKF